MIVCVKATAVWRKSIQYGLIKIRIFNFVTHGHHDRYSIYEFPTKLSHSYENWCPHLLGSVINACASGNVLPNWFF